MKTLQAFVLKRIPIIVFLCSHIINIHAENINTQNLKKVAILDIINTGKNPDYEYLEDSITDAIRTNLKKLFVFQEIDRQKLKEVAEANFLYHDDWHVKSVAMNLGLLANQDIIISGGFKITENNNQTIIVSEIRILDSSRKKIITEFNETGVANNRIFESINRIAVRIAEEAKVVLPSKDDWKRSGLQGGESLPIFSNFSIGTRIGGGLYALEYADRIRAQLPSISINIQANMPILWQKLNFSLQGTYLKDSPIGEKNPGIEGLKISTVNFILQSFLGIDLRFNSFGIMPKVGGGIILQSISVTGIRNEELSNFLPFAGGGLDLSFRLTKNLDLVLAIESFAEFENRKITLLNLASLGVNFKL